MHKKYVVALIQTLTKECDEHRALVFGVDQLDDAMYNLGYAHALEFALYNLRIKKEMMKWES